MAMTFEVSRTVVLIEESDDDPCSLSPPGWYWLYQGGAGANGPFRTMDEAMSAASRGESRETPTQVSGMHSPSALAQQAAAK